MQTFSWTSPKSMDSFGNKLQWAKNIAANNCRVHIASFRGCRDDEQGCLHRCSQWGEELDKV